MPETWPLAEQCRGGVRVGYALVVWARLTVANKPPSEGWVASGQVLGTTWTEGGLGLGQFLSQESFSLPLSSLQRLLFPVPGLRAASWLSLYPPRFP